MQELKLCVLVLMDILFRIKETKIVASDMLSRLNYYKNALAAGTPPRTPLDVKQQITAENFASGGGPRVTFCRGGRI